ncbi:nickel pincer cofactor biosynthesis protein LarB [Sodalis sp. RH21]|uniref:nickel pincer cofactor biosynthesis protein LarB n=1 Tax=unclassified Sodalis (in: enterobacteria) TaxID=2636512 RepID=UPI0039B68909
MNNADMDAITMDFARQARCGYAEAVLCEYKSSSQIEAALVQAGARSVPLLLTRLSPRQFADLSSDWRRRLNYDAVGRCAQLGATPVPAGPARVAIVSGGSSDLPVCQETLITLNHHGVGADLFQDVGVAGLWRLLDQLPRLRAYGVIIAVAGMEAALPTVLAGLVDAALIAVPTSVGYGVSRGGEAALHACLASCAGGVCTVNIDNGYGAAVAAMRIVNQWQKIACETGRMPF